MPFTVGESVGPYRVIEQLGQGGMATVYKAYHAALDRFVAIKVLHPAFMEDANFLARFQREARLVAKLDHPNIVPIHDYAEHEGRPYLVMKFIEGETLKYRLERGRLQRVETSRIVESVGAALAYAHKRGILHRDIKPSNVLLAKDDAIYLADFGLARIAQSGESTLTSDMIVGTPQYISPEQALGKKDLDEGTDIYSFGVMLYEMIVGKVPFSADTPFSVIHDHIYTPLPLPRAVNSEITEAVECVLLKALAKDRPDRYASVPAMVEAFQQAWGIIPEPMPPSTDTSDDAPTEVLVVASTVVAAEKGLSAGGPGAAVASINADTSADALIENPKKPPSKRKLPWMWLAVLVVLLAGCLVTTWAIRSTRQVRNPIREPGIVETLAPLHTPGNLLDVGQALQVVEQKPENPDAHLQLAIAYQQAGMVDQAQEQVTLVDQLAGPNEDFLWNAARQAAANNAWLAAARLALSAAELQPGSLPEDLATLLHEATYKAAEDKAASRYLTTDRLAKVDEPLGQLFKARNTFLAGDLEAGQQILDALMSRKPDFDEGQLLQADFAARSGEFELASQYLIKVRSNPKASGWVLSEANLIEGTLP